MSERPWIFHKKCVQLSDLKRLNLISTNSRSIVDVWVFENRCLSQPSPVCLLSSIWVAKIIIFIICKSQIYWRRQRHQSIISIGMNGLVTISMQILAIFPFCSAFILVSGTRTSYTVGRNIKLYTKHANTILTQSIASDGKNVWRPKEMQCSNNNIKYGRHADNGRQKRRLDRNGQTKEMKSQQYLHQ